jgi:Cys-tRNA(Pro)/Cys-tRNA(Cys) deacylase
LTGGVTALAAKKDYPIYVNLAIERFDMISISAGVRGMQIPIAPQDYLPATKDALAELVCGKGQGSLS